MVVAQGVISFISDFMKSISRWSLHTRMKQLHLKAHLMCI